MKQISSSLLLLLFFGREACSPLQLKIHQEELQCQPGNILALLNLRPHPRPAQPKSVVIKTLCDTTYFPECCKYCSQSPGSAKCDLRSRYRQSSASNKVLLGHSHTHSIACICGYMALYLHTAVLTGTLWPTESVKVNPDCQLDGICNHHGNNTLSMLRRNFIDWGNG